MLDFNNILSFFPERVRSFRHNVLREYLQYKSLAAIYGCDTGLALHFMGGTCIHILHGSPRFSEDLDFDNTGLDASRFEALVETVARAFRLEGYTVEWKVIARRALRAQLRFPSILQETGLTGHREAKLLINLDTEPQRYEYTPDRMVISKFDVITRVPSVPVSVLLAQKFHCILSRPRTMGRDFYDASYLMSKTSPDMGYLRQKLGIGTPDELRTAVLAKCRAVDLEKLAHEVDPFVIDRNDMQRVLLFEEQMTQWCPAG